MTTRDERALTRRQVLMGFGAAALATACESGSTQAEGDAGSVDATPETTSDAASVADTPPVVSTVADTEPIPPVTPNRHHFVTSCCGRPVVDGDKWLISVRDRGAEIGVITLNALEALEARTREHTLECIGTGPSGQKISNAVYSGRTLLDVFAALGITLPVGAAYITITASDGFSTGLPIADLDLPLWLVWRMDGVPLAPEHGYPARLLVPGRYGMKNPKWITAIDFVTEPHIGYWESRGWSDTAVYRPNTFIRAPADGAELPAGTVRFVGTAYAGSDPVERVEVRVDGGEWVTATLDYAPGADIWTLWHFDWETTAGDHTVQARCVTKSGARSSDEAMPAFDGAGYGGSMAITVTIG